MDTEEDKAAPDSSSKPDLFEENFKEVQKWVDVKSSRYGTLYIIRERRKGRLGTALKVFVLLSGGFNHFLCVVIGFRWQ